MEITIGNSGNETMLERFVRLGGELTIPLNGSSESRKDDRAYWRAVAANCGAEIEVNSSRVVLRLGTSDRKMISRRPAQQIIAS